jgi:hypothetical protein
VQDVEYAELRDRLLADEQVLDYSGPIRTGRIGIDPKKLKGVVVDDADAKLTGQWLRSSSIAGYVGGWYLHDNNADKGTCSVRFDLAVPQAGLYEVRIAYAANPNRATNVPVTIQSAEGEVTKTVNQKQTPPIADTWISLGNHRFDAGEPAVITISNKDTDGHVIADAVQLLPNER